MLVIELFCGKFGWSAGALELGAKAIGFDIEHLPHHGSVPDGAELVIQDVLTLRGRQFKHADLILASPPCQKYSWLAMPWSRSKSEHSKAAKALRKEWEENGPDNRLFNACFEIQKDACRAAGRYIPMVVENVRGAQEWVGPAKANFGSFYLWGDVAMVGKRIVARPQFGSGLSPGESFKGGGGSWFAIANNTNGHSMNPVHALTAAGNKGIATDRATLLDGTGGTSWFGAGKRADPRTTPINPDGTRTMPDGTKIGGDWFSDPNSTCRKHGSRSSARKAASAQIAKIPLELSRFIARSYLTDISPTIRNPATAPQAPADFSVR